MRVLAWQGAKVANVCPVSSGHGAMTLSSSLELVLRASPGLGASSVNSSQSCLPHHPHSPLLPPRGKANAKQFGAFASERVQVSSHLPAPSLPSWGCPSCVGWGVGSLCGCVQEIRLFQGVVVIEGHQTGDKNREPLDEGQGGPV